MLIKNITYIDEEYQVQEQQNIVVDGTKIVYIGKEIPIGYKGEVYDGNNKIAAPGFFNIHCHAPMTLIRGYGEGLPLHRWLTERMFPFEALLNAKDIYWGAMLGIAEMIASGAVSITDMYFEMEGMCQAIEESGFKANLSHGCSTGVESKAGFQSVNGYKGIHYLMDYIKSSGHDRIKADASIHAEYTANDYLIRDIAEFAKANQLGIHLHLSETKQEHLGAKERRDGLSAAAWFNQNGVFDVPVTAAHCVWVDEADMDLMAQKGVTAVHCSSSNLKLGSGIAPLQKFIQKGIRVGIGTDGAASNNNLNMLEEVNLASILQKGAANDPLFMGTAQTFQLACKNGAASQGRKDCGSIKVGNRADIVIYDMDRPNMLPVFDAAANLLYAASSQDIVLSMIDGKVVYQNGEYKTIDIEKVKFHAKRIAKEKLEILNK